MRMALVLAALCSLCAGLAAADKESGTYAILLKGERVGECTYSVLDDGSWESAAKLSLAGQEIDMSLTVRFQDGKWTKIEGKQKQDAFEFYWEDGKLHAKGKSGDKVLDAPPDSCLFGNFHPHLIRDLLSRYDLAKGGNQKLKAMIVESGTSLEMTVAVPEKMERLAGGKLQPIFSYRVEVVKGLDILVFADADGRVLAWDVPVQSYRAVLNGYENLFKETEPADPLLSKPTHNVKEERGVRVAMRDGVKLAADVYRPEEEGRYPVILVRTPYGKAAGGIEAPYYARRGYAYVVMDCRGRDDSEGEWEPLVNEAKDGFDSVKWCAEQPWSSGSVGMIGGSYLGWVQWMAARENPPWLKCIIPQVAPPDPFWNFPYDHGTFFLAGAFWWCQAMSSKEVKFDPNFDFLPALKTLPLDKVDDVAGADIPFFNKWLQHDTYDEYWKSCSFTPYMKNINIPVLHISGWYDGDGIGTKRNYAEMVRLGKKNQHLIYGPWPHAFNTTTRMGELDFGPKAHIDLDTICLRWFDRWLKNVENRVDKEPPVSVFVMRENEWRKFSEWPPREGELQRWYLHSDGYANGAKANGKLSREKPKAEEPDRFFYNPAELELPKDLKIDISKQSEAGPVDIEKDPEMSASKKMLVYTSEAITEPLVIAGPVSLKLYAATSAKDTDWFALLADVTPDGKSLYLCSGKIRAKFRSSWEKPQLLEPNKAYDYILDLWATGIKLEKGHKLRVYIGSSLFPSWARNLNTGEGLVGSTRMVPAHQTVYHDASRASYLEVYVVKQ